MSAIGIYAKNHKGGDMRRDQDELLKLLEPLVLISLVVLLACWLAGCDSCHANKQWCEGGASYVCNPYEMPVEVAACDLQGPTWECNAGRCENEQPQSLTVARFPTSEDVLAYVDYLETTYHVHIVPPDNSKSLPQEVWEFLRRLGVQELTGYSVTVDNRIYPSFTPGDGAGFALVRQVATLAHEVEHVRQWRDDNGFTYKYLADPVYRAHVEAEAKSTEAAVQNWLIGTYDSPAYSALNLRERYMVPCWAADYAEIEMGVAIDLIEQGGIWSDVQSKTARFFETRWRE